MRLAVLFTGALLGLLAGQGTGNDCPHKKSATLLPSFTVTPTSSTGRTSHSTTKSHTTTTHNPTTTTSQKPTTTTHNPTTTTHNPTTTTSQKPTTTTHSPTTTSQKLKTTTHNPTTTTTHGNTTVHPTTDNGTTTSSPQPGPPPPPSPSPDPGSKVIGNYTWTNGSEPCVRLQAQIQIRILYPTQAGKEAWGISVLNPNKTKAHGGCESTHPQLLLSFPYGQLSFGFKQEPLQNTVYLNYMAVEYNVSFPQAAQSTFSVKNSSLQDLQAPLGYSFSCENATIALTPAFHLDLLSLRLQAAQLPPTGDFGPSVSCTSDHSILLPLIIGLILLGLCALVLVTFCIIRKRPPAYQPL